MTDRAAKARHERACAVRTSSLRVQIKFVLTPMKFDSPTSYRERDKRESTHTHTHRREMKERLSEKIFAARKEEINDKAEVVQPDLQTRVSSRDKNYQSSSTF